MDDDIDVDDEDTVLLSQHSLNLDEDNFYSKIISIEQRKRTNIINQLIEAGILSRERKHKERLHIKTYRKQLNSLSGEKLELATEIAFGSNINEIPKMNSPHDIAIGQDILGLPAKKMKRVSISRAPPRQLQLVCTSSYFHIIMRVILISFSAEH
jgi:hypothetical protein